MLFKKFHEINQNIALQHLKSGIISAFLPSEKYCVVDPQPELNAQKFRRPPAQLHSVEEYLKIFHDRGYALVDGEIEDQPFIVVSKVKR